MNKISGGRQLLEVRASRIKRQAMNNFLEERLNIANDLVKEEEAKGKGEEKEKWRENEEK